MMTKRVGLIDFYRLNQALSNTTNIIIIGDLVEIM